MPNWKKVIVSGSDAVLSSVTATAGLTVTGSALITGSLVVTGSVIATAGFTGSLQGTASLADTIHTARTTDAAIHWLTFVDSANIGPQPDRVWTSYELQYIPKSGSLTATSFTGSLRGTASYATIASQSGYTMQFVLTTSASNPAPNTTYIMGAPVRHHLTPATGSTRIYVPRPGRVSYAQVFIKTMVTSSAGQSTFRLYKTNTAGSTLFEQIANSTSAGRNYTASVVSTALTMSVVQGDWLEIAWSTPNYLSWSTAPRGVEANAIIYIENNI